MATLRITVLSENTVKNKGLLAEHGWALWIEVGDKKILFDTGQGKVLNNNACHLGIDLEHADAVVLSHGHYDHTGGLDKICAQKKKPVVYSHPAAFAPKYSKHVDGSVHHAGIPPLAEKAVSQDAALMLDDKPREVFAGFQLTGEIPRITDFEDTGGAFFLDPDCIVSDPLQDDQAGFIDTSSGLVAILGCAHSGTINCLHYIQKLTGNRPIHTLIGGMHLGTATNERIDKTILEIRNIGVKHLFPAHCTGFEATARLCHEFPAICSPCNVGMVIETAM